MSKAEEYSFNIESELYNQLTPEQQKLWRKDIEDAWNNAYCEAEKDLELTWKDVSFIRLAFDAIEANIYLGAIKVQPMTKEYYQEVLKRFNKERKQQ